MDTAKVIYPNQIEKPLQAHMDLEFIEVQTGSELVEEDIIRVSLEWKDIVQFSS